MDQASKLRVTALQNAHRATHTHGLEPYAIFPPSRGHLDATAVAYHLYRTWA
jgi:hypothetical protein